MDTNILEVNELVQVYKSPIRENIALPLVLSGQKKKISRQR